MNHKKPTKHKIYTLVRITNLSLSRENKNFRSELRLLKDLIPHKSHKLLTTLTEYVSYKNYRGSMRI